MTHIYFVRHAEPNHSWEDDRSRPLTEEGLLDANKLIEFFKNITIDSFNSSPYKRSFDTILPTADYMQKIHFYLN